MIKIAKANSNFYQLIGVFSETKTKVQIVCEQNYLTIFPKQKKAYLFLGEMAKYSKNILRKAIFVIGNANRFGFNVEFETFQTKLVTTIDVVKMFIEEYHLLATKTWNQKTTKPKNKNFKEIILIGKATSKIKQEEWESRILVEAQIFARNMQKLPPNLANSIDLSKLYQQQFTKLKNVKLTILTKQEIKKLKMGLFLGVNKGSNFEPRLVVIEYQGDPKSTTKTVMVGKGITFDTGGINLKPSRAILGMKYDMSGSAIVVAALKVIAQFKPKANVSIVAPLTDNNISKTATLPDSVLTSMSGKTVEINNTDAEGRLILADGITYAIKKLKATRIIDVATLTGAVVVALGHTFTGVWATKDSDWNLVKKIAHEQNELVWRMPFHIDFFTFMQKSNVADFKNTDMSQDGGYSSSAAMFLKQFTNNLPFIHFDIAGTASKNEKTLAPMVKTLVKLFN